MCVFVNSYTYVCIYICSYGSKCNSLSSIYFNINYALKCVWIQHGMHAFYTHAYTCTYIHTYIYIYIHITYIFYEDAYIHVRIHSHSYQSRYPTSDHLRLVTLPSLSLTLLFFLPSHLASLLVRILCSTPLLPTFPHHLSLTSTSFLQNKT